VLIHEANALTERPDAPPSSSPQVPPPFPPLYLFHPAAHARRLPTRRPTQMLVALNSSISYALLSHESRSRPAHAESVGAQAPIGRIPALQRGAIFYAPSGVRMQPSSTYSRRALHQLPLWFKRATGLDKRLAHRDIAEITRMLRAPRAAEEDARPRIVHMRDAMQVAASRHQLSRRGVRLTCALLWQGTCSDLPDGTPDELRAVA
jgi:hypothetical protein